MLIYDIKLQDKYNTCALLKHIDKYVYSAGKGLKHHLFPISKPHTHIIYMLRQFTSIIYIYNIRSATIYNQRQYTISDNIRLSTIYNQRKYTIIYNILSATIYNFLQYTISENIRLSTIYNQRKYTIIYNIQSAKIYDYLQYTISNNIRSATTYDYL